jgi:hypothetical protein
MSADHSKKGPDQPALIINRRPTNRRPINRRPINQWTPEPSARADISEIALRARTNFIGAISCSAVSACAGPSGGNTPEKEIFPFIFR